VPLKIVLNGAVVYHLRDLLQSKLATPAEIVRLAGSETPAQRDEICRDADVLVAIKNHELPLVPGLKLLQVPGAGLDQIDLARVPAQAWVCNAYGHDIASAEYIVLGMLAACHDFIEAHESFKAGSWRLSGRFGAPLHEELHGKTVGVLGLGSIGLATAKLAKAFGTTVIGLNRTPRCGRPTWTSCCRWPRSARCCPGATSSPCAWPRPRRRPASSIVRRSWR
jgi:lactate dehydrogenase-like 2-hydroxyacid dehydrogenase